MQWKLQPRAVEAATPCARGCNPVLWRLQPRAPEAASSRSHARRWARPSARLHPTICAFKRLLVETHARQPVAMFVDLHGHSRKQNVFMYGCAPERGDGLLQKVFPLAALPATLHPACPLHSSCSHMHPSCNPTHLACNPAHPGLPAASLARRAHLRFRLVLLLDQEEQGGHRPRRRASRAIA